MNGTEAPAEDPQTSEPNADEGEEAYAYQERVRERFRESLVVERRYAGASSPSEKWTPDEEQDFVSQLWEKYGEMDGQDNSSKDLGNGSD